MATADSVKAKIQGLIATANAKTGKNDTELTSAVNNLCEGYGSGGGSGGSAPNLLHAESTVEDFIAAMEAWQNNGTDCAFFDGAELCKFVAVDVNGIGYFLKGSTKQLIAVTLGESVSIQYVDIGGSGGGGIAIKKATYTSLGDCAVAIMANNWEPVKVVLNLPPEPKFGATQAGVTGDQVTVGKINTIAVAISCGAPAGANISMQFITTGDYAGMLFAAEGWRNGQYFSSDTEDESKKLTVDLTPVTDVTLYYIEG